MRNLCLLVLLFLLVSCSDREPLRSAGSPYYVVIENDCDSMVFHALDADVEGLPQREPSFDILEITGNYPEYTLCRNIVRVKIDKEYDSPQIRYDKNVYASPQIVIHVCAPNEKALKVAMPSIGQQLRSLLNNAEMNVAISYLKRHHLQKEQERISQSFNADFYLPEELTASKQGEKFSWYSDNQAHGMQNICLYTYPAKDLNAEEWIVKRDSIMKRNIPGEEEGMYMTTVKESINHEVVSVKGQKRLITRGLWEMKNDMMGGPLVAHAVYDTARATVIVAEAFVFAPESKKRNKIRQLEAALYTLNIQNNGK